VERFVDFHLHLPPKKRINKKFSVSGQGDHHCFLGLLRCDSCRYSAKRRESKLWHKHQGANKAQEGFHRNLASNDSARPYTSLKTLEQITNFGWTVLPHPPYSSCLSPSRFLPLGALKDAVCGMNLRVWFTL